MGVLERIEDHLKIIEAEVLDIRSRLNQKPDRRLTRKMVSIEFQVSLGTINNAMKRGDLKYNKIGRKPIFQLSEVEKWEKLRK